MKFWGFEHIEKDQWDNIGHHNTLVERLLKTEDPPALVLTCSIWDLKGNPKSNNVPPLSSLIMQGLPISFFQWTSCLPSLSPSLIRHVANTYCWLQTHPATYTSLDQSTIQSTGARPNLDGAEEAATWFRFSPASILRCKNAAGTNLICIVTRDALDVAQQQTEASRTHSLFVCQAKNAADAYNFAAAVAESKAAWTATAKSIMLQNFSLYVIVKPVPNHDACCCCCCCWQPAAAAAASFNLFCFH